VEGFADLLAAETEQQRVQALENASGALSKATHAWRQRLLRCMAHIEARRCCSSCSSLEHHALTQARATQAVIDFGDDEDLSEDVAQGAHATVHALAADIRRQLQHGAWPARARYARGART